MRSWIKYLKTWVYRHHRNHQESQNYKNHSPSTVSSTWSAAFLLEMCADPHMVVQRLKNWTELGALKWPGRRGLRFGSHQDRGGPGKHLRFSFGTTESYNLRTNVNYKWTRLPKDEKSNQNQHKLWFPQDFSPISC